MTNYTAADNLAEIEHELQRRRDNWRSSKRQRNFAIMEAVADDYRRQVEDYDSHKDVAGYFEEAYRAIRERVAAGGPGWKPKEPGK